jgi:2-oxoisovalerate dehydrogenase E1 component
MARPLTADFDWTSWRSAGDDLAALDPLVAARMLFDVLTIQSFEHAVLDLQRQGCVWGPVHSSVGQEATAAASAAACRTGDKWTGTHRAHHQFLSKALDHVLPEQWNPADDEFPPGGATVLRRTLAEIMGLKTGFGGGRGGSMHLRWKEAGYLGSNAIVAGGIPLSVGAAFAEKARKTGNVVVAFFGDGALNQGAFHESANLAGCFGLPLVLFLENNSYAVATRIDDVCAVEEPAVRAAGYGMPALSVDASDIVALHALMREATRLARAGQPVLADVRCYRRYHHAGDQPGSAYDYRTREEEEEGFGKEVAICFPKALERVGVLTSSQVQRIRAMSQEVVKAAIGANTQGTEPRQVRAELIPDPATACQGLRSDESEFNGVKFQERGDFHAFGTLRYGDAIAAVTGRWLEKNAEAIVLGEEVANFGGGAYGATRDLAERYPDRVLNMPISESGFVGLGLGAAMSDLPVIVEIMFPDFSFVAADQLFNQVAKARHMYGNTTDLPMVVRTRVATGCGYGGQHSLSPAGLYALFSGWRIVAPADAFDYVGLFNAAMISLDPVLVIEHHALYQQEMKLPKGDLDYVIRFGKGRRVSAGDDVTLITYSNLVPRCCSLLPAWKAAGISVDLIDLRSIDFPSVDYDLIGESVRRTGAVVIAEQACRSHALGHRIAQEVTERFFDWLDGPVRCLTSRDVPPPVSRWLEAAVLLGDNEIEKAVIESARREWR